MGEPYISGTLNVVKRTSLEQRYFRLYADRLDYYLTEGDFSEDLEPRGRINLQEVSAVHLTEEGFTLEMGSQEFALIAEGDDREQWATQVVRACEEHSINYSRVEDEDDEEEEEGSGEETQEEIIVKQGVLSIAKKSNLVERFFALTHESFTYWESEADMEAGHDHRGMIEVGHITQLVAVDDGFDIHVRGLGKPLQLRNSSADDRRDWIEKWAQILQERLGDKFQAGADAEAADSDAPGPSKTAGKEASRPSKASRPSGGVALRSGASRSLGATRQPEAAAAASPRSPAEEPDNGEEEALDEAAPQDADFVGEALPSPILSSSEKKLWEVFELSGKDAARTHYITKGGFLETCRTRHLVTDFFGLQRTPDGVVGMEAFQALFETVGVDGGPKQNISWDTFKEFHRAWERRNNDPLQQRLAEIEDSGKADLLHEGPARILQWPGAETITEPALDTSDFRFVELDLSTGHARMIMDFEYIKRPSPASNKGSGKGGGKSQVSEPPVAAFARPDEAREAIAELLLIWKRLYGSITVAYRLKAPSNSQSPVHQKWLYDFAVSRVELVRIELIQVGIPEQFLSTRIDASTTAQVSAHHFEFNVQAPVRHVRIFRGMVECCPDESGTAHAMSGIPTIGSVSIRAVHAFPGGFKLEVDQTQPVEAELLPTEDITPWSSALNQLLEHGHRLRTTVLRKTIALGGMERLKSATGSPPTSAKHGPFERGSDFMNEASNPLVEEWLARLPEAPAMFGVLGFQDKGSLCARFCVLFKDRLDCWERPLDAANGKRHFNRIHLRDIKEFEIIGSGLVLTLVARKVGIHNRTYQDLYLWSEALRLQLQPPLGDGQLPDEQDHEKAKEKERKPKQEAKPNFPGRSIQDIPAPEWKRRTEKKSSICLARDESLHWRLKQGKGVVVNTHKDGGEAAQRLHGVGETKVLPSPSARARASPSASTPAGKITEHALGLGNNSNAIRNHSGKLVADKVTGSRSGNLGAKPDDLAWVKINHIQHPTNARHSNTRAKPAAAGSRSSPPCAQSPVHRVAVAQKITEVSRAPKTALKKSPSPFKITNSKGRSTRRSSQSRTFKITEAGRGPNAWQNARVAIYAGSVDKAKSFGSG